MKNTLHIAAAALIASTTTFASGSDLWNTNTHSTPSKVWTFQLSPQQMVDPLDAEDALARELLCSSSPKNQEYARQLAEFWESQTNQSR